MRDTLFEPSRRSGMATISAAGTPAPIVQRLHQEIDKILKQRDVKERFATLGIDPASLSSQEFGDFQKAEIAKLAKVVTDAHLKID